MAFKTYIYESDLPNDAEPTVEPASYKIKLDTDQATLAGAVIAGATTAGFTIVNYKNRRQRGLHPRRIICSRFVGTAPNDRKFSTSLAICTQAAYDAISAGDAVSINGINYVVEIKEPEFKR